MNGGRFNLRLFYYLIIITLLLSAAGSVLADQKKICDFCKREISTGQYIKAGNAYFHADHFFCQNCRKSLVNQPYGVIDGKYYCEKCFKNEKLPICAFCGEMIETKYVTENGKTYHKTCYDKHIALKCSLCGGIIEGEYLYDFWGNKYHKYHQNSIPSCTYCQRLLSDKLTKGGTQLIDGRWICGLCGQDAVNQPREAEKLMASVAANLKKFGIEIPMDKITLHLIDKNKLDKLSANSMPNNSGLTRYEWKVVSSKIRQQQFNIYLLFGMPKTTYKSAIAHELMHVWLYSYAPLEMDPALSEGSCNYASYLILQDDRNDLSRYIIDSMEKNPDQLYGKGFRRIKKFALRVGLEKWLDHLRSNKNFPFGF